MVRQSFTPLGHSFDLCSYGAKFFSRRKTTTRRPAVGIFESSGRKINFEISYPFNDLVSPDTSGGQTFLLRAGGIGLLTSYLRILGLPTEEQELFQYLIKNDLTFSLEQAVTFFFENEGRELARKAIIFVHNGNLDNVRVFVMRERCIKNREIKSFFVGKGSIFVFRNRFDLLNKSSS